MDAVQKRGKPEISFVDPNIGEIAEERLRSAEERMVKIDKESGFEAMKGLQLSGR